MKHGNRKQVLLAVLFLVVFVLWTVLVYWVDVQPIGPGGSAVGFGTLNSYVHDLTGVHMGLYVLTDWLSLIPPGDCGRICAAGTYPVDPQETS